MLCAATQLAGEQAAQAMMSDCPCKHLTACYREGTCTLQVLHGHFKPAVLVDLAWPAAPDAQPHVPTAARAALISAHPSSVCSSPIGWSGTPEPVATPACMQHVPAWIHATSSYHA
jgi:hypothetical protein